MAPKLAWSADEIVWQDIAADGTKYALLEGERDKADVPFTYAFAIPAGFWDPPHAHSRDARVFVAKGTLYLGDGEIEDRSRSQAFPAGSLVIVPAPAVHFDGSDQETVIVGCAVGPWATVYVDAQHRGSSGTPRP